MIITLMVLRFREWPLTYDQGCGVGVGVVESDFKVFRGIGVGVVKL